MRPLSLLRTVLSWLSVVPIDGETTKWKRISYKIFPLFVITGILTCLISSFAYFWEYVSIDMEASLYALFQVAAQFNMLNAIVVTAFSRQKIKSLFKNLEIIFNTNANDDSFVYLTRANKRAEWIFKTYAKFVFATIINGLVVMPIISMVFCLMTNGSFDPNIVYFPFRHILPWDQYALHGYIYELVFDFISASDCMFFSGLLFMLFVSLCLFHATFYRMFEHSVRKLDCKENRNNNKFLCGLIRFHTSIKGCFVESAELYSPYILVQLISFMILMACNVFQLDLLLRHIDYTITVVIPMSTITISNLFFYCFFGKLATESFLKMGDCLYDSNWQVLPVESQKYLILMIANMQRPLYYHGSGIAVLNLETFTKCVKTILTYYMAFKTLTE